LTEQWGLLNKIADYGPKTTMWVYFADRDCVEITRSQDEFNAKIELFIGFVTPMQSTPWEKYVRETVRASSSEELVAALKARSGKPIMNPSRLVFLHRNFKSSELPQESESPQERKISFWPWLRNRVAQVDQGLFEFVDSAVKEALALPLGLPPDDVKDYRIQLFLEQDGKKVSSIGIMNADQTSCEISFATANENKPKKLTARNRSEISSIIARRIAARHGHQLHAPKIWLRTTCTSHRCSFA
jgi:hypothetical protein